MFILVWCCLKYFWKSYFRCWHWHNAISGRFGFIHRSALGTKVGLVFGILGVGIDTVELSVTVHSKTFKKGLGLKGWYLSTRPRTAAEMNNPSTVFALLSTVMKHYSWTVLAILVFAPVFSFCNIIFCYKFFPTKKQTCLTFSQQRRVPPQNFTIVGPLHYMMRIYCCDNNCWCLEHNGEQMYTQLYILWPSSLSDRCHFSASLSKVNQ